MVRKLFSVADPKTVDRRSKAGKALAARLNRESVLEQMPKIYFVKDDYANNYRVGRTDWPGDTFNIYQPGEFNVFAKIMGEMNYPLLDKTHDDE